MRMVLALAFLAFSLLTVGCSGSDMSIVAVPTTDAAATDDAAKTDAGPTPGQDAAPDAVGPELDAGAQDAADATPAPAVTITGKADGVSIAPAGSGAVRSPLGNLDYVRVVIATEAASCGRISSGHFPPDVKALTLHVTAGGDGGTATHVVPGTYPLGNQSAADHAEVTIVQRDQTCTLQFLVQSEPLKDTGSVTIEAIDELHVKGSFTFQKSGSSEGMSGAFDVPFCDAADVDAGAGAC